MKQAKMLLFSQYIFSQWYELTLFLQLVNCSGSGAPNFSVEILHPFINLLFKAEKIWECATCGRHRWNEKKTSLYTMTVTQTAQMRWAVLCFPTSKGLTLAWSLINVMGWCIGEVACIMSLPGRVSASWVIFVKLEEANQIVIFSELLHAP